MAVSTRNKVILWGRAAARCSKPECRKSLVEDPGDVGEDIALGEIAHIVAQSPNGPRGNKRPPGGSLDGQDNLILLCQDHHTTIDRQPQHFPVAKLLQWKSDHEQWVREQLSPREEFVGIETPSESIEETVYSTLLSVQHLPGYVHVADCDLTEAAVQEGIEYADLANDIVAPFIIRGKKLMTFCDLKEEKNPFKLVVDPYSAETKYAQAWWDDPDQYRWYVQLLNRSMNKLTGRMGLNFDKDHHRYYFEPSPVNGEKSIEYRAMGGKKQTRNVVWQPRIKATGDKRHYWEHLAVGLRFHRVDTYAWCVTVRPERRFTRDGHEPLTPKGIGRRSTSRKSHMYNLDVLSEVHFWRAFLSRGQPRIILRYGTQSLVIDANILTGRVCWPEIPGDEKKRMKMLYEDDLVSMAAYDEAIEFEDRRAVDLDAHTEMDDGERDYDEAE